MTRRISPSEPVQTEIDRVSDAPLRVNLGYHIKRAFTVIQADLHEALKPFELRMLSYSVLVLIVENPGIRQSQLSDTLAIERPNLVVIIDGLEKRELITRDRLNTDRRVYLLQATLAGRRLRDKAVAAVSAHEDTLFGDLDSDLRTEMKRALREIEHRAAADTA